MINLSCIKLSGIYSSILVNLLVDLVFLGVIFANPKNLTIISLSLGALVVASLYSLYYGIKMKKLSFGLWFMLISVLNILIMIEIVKPF